MTFQAGKITFLNSMTFRDAWKPRSEWYGMCYSVHTESTLLQRIPMDTRSMSQDDCMRQMQAT